MTALRYTHPEGIAVVTVSDGASVTSYEQGHADGRADVAKMLRERAEGLRAIARHNPNSESAKRALKAAEELSRVANRVVKKKWRGR